MLLGLLHNGENVDEQQNGSYRNRDDSTTNIGYRSARGVEEIGEMQRQIDTVANVLRQQLDKLQTEHRQILQRCAKQWRSVSNGLATVARNRHRRMESVTEECRLRNALLSEKFRNCSEYLQDFDAMIRAIQRERQQKNEEDDFLREFLLKAARRQQRKGQLGPAVDTFCQLMIATDGRLRREEMELLVEVCREKIRCTREFHERISDAVQQQVHDSLTLCGNSFVVEELWGQVLEDLRSECAEAFEIVMQVKNDEILDTEEFISRAASPQKQSIEQLKLLMASTICALWLQITPRGHEEFDEVKELFFGTLDNYIGTFNAKNRAIFDHRDDMTELEKAIRQLIGEYPTVAESKKMRKIAQRMMPK